MAYPLVGDEARVMSSSFIRRRCTVVRRPVRVSPAGHCLCDFSAITLFVRRVRMAA